jgi:hypothetical protein
LLQIREINTKKEFYDLKNCWDKILDSSIEDNIFLTWEKMAPSVNHLGQNSLLKILCATEDDRLVGIAPFRFTYKELKGYVRFGIIEPLTNGNTDYTGLIIAEQKDLCLKKFLAYLYNQKDWDLLYLPDLPETSPILALLKKAIAIPKFEVENGVICPYIKIPNTKEELLKNLKRNFEKKLRKSLTKLEREQGKVELRNFFELGSLEDAVEVLIDLHQKRWRSKGNPGRFVDEESKDITLETAKFFAEKGWLRLYFLMVRDVPVAVEFDLEYKKKMYCHLKGLDPIFYRYRVGSLLTLKVLEECVAKGIAEYDLMQGDETYKFDWTSKYRQNMNVKWVNNKVFSKLLDAGLKISKTGRLDIIIKYL